MATGGTHYERRRPENTALYKVVQEHLQTFLATMEEAERTLPKYVVQEFERYLECGILAYGFARVVCGDCGHTRLVAFACKSRSFCPSCVGRTMNETAAYLVDHVIGDIPVRHWVLTLPPPLRYLVAYDGSLCTAVVRAFIESIFAHLRNKAKQEFSLRSVKDAHPASVTTIQRASSHLALNPHFHSVVTDGVYVRDASGKLIFRALQKPSKAEVAAVGFATCEKVMKLLRKRGIWLDSEPADDPFAQDEPGLAACASASVQGVLLLGKKAGQRLMRLYGQAANSDGYEPPPQSQIPGYGFCVHAERRISANDKSGREKLCRYLHHPPLAQERVNILPNGNVSVGLKRAFSDGTTHVVFEPLDFLSKLAALVPPPRTHRTRYHGLWAAHAKGRDEVTPKSEETEKNNEDASSENCKHKTKRYKWARLLARVFAVDVLQCPKCKGQMQRVAFITEPLAIRKILKSVGLPADSPQPAPSRLGEQQELFAMG